MTECAASSVAETHGSSSSPAASNPSILTLEDLGKGAVVSSAWVYHAANPLESIQFIKINEAAITHSLLCPKERGYS